METIAKLVKDARIRAGLTQEQLSARTRVTQSAISRVETGREQPTLATLRRLTRALDVSAAEVVAALEGGA